MKVAIIILAADGYYTPLCDAIRETWAAKKHPDIDIYYNYCIRTKDITTYHFLHGTPETIRIDYPGIPKPPDNETILHEDQIICGYEDGMKAIHDKTLDAYEWIAKNREYDFVFRCCCGSYVLQDRLYEYLKDKPKENYYAGPTGYTEHGDYASGSGFFLSWDLVKLIGLNKKSVERVNSIYDDVNIGYYLKEQGIKVQECPRHMFHGDLELEYTKELVKDHDHYHYHLHHDYKSDNFHTLHKALIS